jgi:hypothetical protein
MISSTFLPSFSRWSRPGAHYRRWTRGVKPVQIASFRRSRRGPVHVAYVVFLGSIIFCTLYKLTLSDKVQVTLQLCVSFAIGGGGQKNIFTEVWGHSRWPCRWSTEHVRTFCRREQSLPQPGIKIQFLSCPIHSLVTTPNTLTRPHVCTAQIILMLFL